MACILTHPEMTAADLETHLAGVFETAFRRRFPLSLASSLFAVEGAGTDVAYRGYYQSEAIREVLGEEPQPRIIPFALSDEERRARRASSTTRSGASGGSATSWRARSPQPRSLHTVHRLASGLIFVSGGFGEALRASTSRR
ncbi:MAG TPA: hypothetical protein VNN12_05040 [Dehalococcoidia bacterium]|nr:hypothetical protein [Dehalococcoidia bacterium]